jgi:hypothetical protein
LQTNVVTVEAARDAVKVPPVTETAVPALMLSFAEVTFGVHEAGAVPPAIEIGMLTADVLLLMATMTVPSVPVKAERRTFVLEFPVTSTIT